MKGKITLLLLILTTVGMGYLVYLQNTVNIKVDNTFVRIESVNSKVYYSVASDTEMKCNIEAFSTLIDRMVADGYNVEQETNSDKEIDIVLSKDDVVIRIKYNINGDFTTISYPLEKSYLPITYINESYVEE